MSQQALGTGVGGGVMLGGTLFTGHNGAAAEPGLITLNPEGPDCNSGNQGSLEQFASISGLGVSALKIPPFSLKLPHAVMPRL